MIGIIGKKFLSYKSQKITNNRKRRQLFPTKKSKKNKKTGPDEFYGLAEPLKDNDDILSNEELELIQYRIYVIICSLYTIYKLHIMFQLRSNI